MNPIRIGVKLRWVSFKRIVGIKAGLKFKGLTMVKVITPRPHKWCNRKFLSQDSLRMAYSVSSVSPCDISQSCASLSSCMWTRADGAFFRVWYAVLKFGFSKKAHKPSVSLFGSCRLIGGKVTGGWECVFLRSSLLSVSGAALHVHDFSMVGVEWLVKNVTYRENCYVCFTNNSFVRFVFSSVQPKAASYCSTWTLLKTMREKYNTTELDNRWRNLKHYRKKAGTQPKERRSHWTNMFFLHSQLYSKPDAVYWGPRQWLPQPRRRLGEVWTSFPGGLWAGHACSRL